MKATQEQTQPVEPTLRAIAKRWAAGLPFVQAKLALKKALGTWNRFNEETSKRGGFRKAMTKLVETKPVKAAKPLHGKKARAA